MNEDFMKTFLNENFILQSEEAKTLYNDNQGARLG